jgi:hypothetical protein
MTCIDEKLQNKSQKMSFSINLIARCMHALKDSRILRYGMKKESTVETSHNRCSDIATFGIVCKILSSSINGPKTIKVY